MEPEPQQRRRCLSFQHCSFAFFLIICTALNSASCFTNYTPSCLCCAVTMSNPAWTHFKGTFQIRECKDNVSFACQFVASSWPLKNGYLTLPKPYTLSPAVPLQHPGALSSSSLIPELCGSRGSIVWEQTGAGYSRPPVVTEDAQSSGTGVGRLWLESVVSIYVYWLFSSALVRTAEHSGLLSLRNMQLEARV